MKKLDSSLQKQQQGWPKISNTAQGAHNLAEWGERENLLGKPLLTNPA